jgi:UDP-GlcNAc:undecaprenyl-phosphate/decaprenyl-phosphate GlcNAc-1-phosphate transferase
MVVVAAVTFLATPLARRAAVAAGALARVRERDVHTDPTPRWGGIAMFAGLISAYLIAGQLPLLERVFQSGPEARAILSGALVVCALGVADDLWGIDALTKLAGQALAASLLVVQGVQLLWLPINGVTALPPIVGPLLTVLIIVVTINAVNFVDGLDGLAAGIVAIAGISFFAFSYLLAVVHGFSRAGTPTFITAALVGMCLGFLPHNVSPARIFMGDSGSMLLGLLLASSAITLTGQLDGNVVSTENLAPALLPLLLPFAVLSVPILDLLLAVVRRTRAGRSPFAPDKQHLHHRLLEIGHSHRRAAAVLYLWTAILALPVTAAAFWPIRIVVAGTAVAVVAAIVITFHIASTSLNTAPQVPSTPPLPEGRLRPESPQ